MQTGNHYKSFLPFKNGEKSFGFVTGYRYITHLYCLAVQAGFYSDVVECRTLSPADQVRSPVGEKCDLHFFNCYRLFQDFGLLNVGHMYRFYRRFQKTFV